MEKDRSNTTEEVKKSFLNPEIELRREMASEEVAVVHEENGEKEKKKTSIFANMPHPPEIVLEKVTSKTGKVFFRKYVRGKMLGKGGFARCYEFTNTENGKIYAAKVVAKSTLTKEKTKIKLIGEIKIHRSLMHQNIVTFKHYFEDKENVYIILELCHNKSLMEMLRRRKNLTETEVRYFMLQIVSAVEYLHSNQIIHRDLKLGNLFIDQNMRIKVGDFGLATKVNYMNEKKRTICGTPNYIAPEILSSELGHSYEVDIWSIGVIMYTLLIGTPPFQTADVKSTYKRIKANSYSFPNDITISSSFESLVRWILNTSPHMRPTLQDIRNHLFFSDPSVFIPKTLTIDSLRNTPNFHKMDLVDENEDNEPMEEPEVPSKRKKPYGLALPIKRPNRSSSPFTKTKHEIFDQDDFFNSSSVVKDDKIIKVLDDRVLTCPNQVCHLMKLKENINHNDAKSNVNDNNRYNYVTKWVDFTSKYGLGYLLSNGSVGIYFNDATKIILDSEGEVFEYIERTKHSEQYYKSSNLAEKEKLERQRYAADEYPLEIRKKVILLDHFAKYLQKKNGDDDSENSECPNSAFYGSKKINIDFVRKWHRLPNAIIFRFDDNSLQIQFNDQTQIVLCCNSSKVIFFDKDGSKNIYNAESVLLSEDLSVGRVKKRLLYLLDVQDLVRPRRKLKKSIALDYQASNMETTEQLGQANTDDLGNSNSMLYIVMVFMIFYYYGPSDSFIAWIIMLFVLFIGNLYLNQESMLYVPNPPGFNRKMSQNPAGFQSPSEYSMKFEPVFITNKGVRVFAWLILQNKSSNTAPTIMYFHGNAGNIGNRLPYYAQLYNTLKVNILAIEYRGYGESQGKPSEEDIASDSHSFYDYLQTRSDVVDTNNLVVFGRSLGGAVATKFVFEKQGDSNIRMLIVENTFLSVGHMAMKLFSFLKFVQGLFPILLKSQWDSRQIIGQITQPILFLSSSNDQLVPTAHMEELFVLAEKGNDGNIKKGKNKFISFTIGTHNDIPIVEAEKYHNSISSFFVENRIR